MKFGFLDLENGGIGHLFRLGGPPEVKLFTKNTIFGLFRLFEEFLLSPQEKGPMGCEKLTVHTDSLRAGGPDHFLWIPCPQEPGGRRRPEVLRFRLAFWADFSAETLDGQTHARTHAHADTGSVWMGGINPLLRSFRSSLRSVPGTSQCASRCACARNGTWP